jgi:hypothetical protein
MPCLPLARSKLCRILLFASAFSHAEDCNGALDRFIAESGETCAEKVVSYMHGEKLMPPRRAMGVVAMEYFECQGLMSDFEDKE